MYGTGGIEHDVKTHITGPYLYADELQNIVGHMSIK